MMALDDVPTYSQSQTHTLPGLFRREKGFENARHDVGGNSGTVVSNPQRTSPPVLAETGAHPQISAVRHGIDRIDDQSQQYLLDLAGIAVNGWETLRQFAVEFHAIHFELVSDQPQAAVHNGIEIGGLQVHGCGAGESEKVAH